MTFLGPGRLRQLAHRDHVGPALHELLHFEADFAEIDVEVLQHVGGHPAPLFDQAQEDVLGADIFVIEPLGFLVGQLHDLPARSVNRSYMYILRSIVASIVVTVVSSGCAAASLCVFASAKTPVLVVSPTPICRRLQIAPACRVVRLLRRAVRCAATTWPTSAGRPRRGGSAAAALQHVLRLIVVAFQVMVQGFGKGVSFVDRGSPRLLGDGTA